MIEPITADAFTPKFAKLVGAGWTVWASDESPECPSRNVLDGDTATIWHSGYLPTGSPMPHSITIDMHATMKDIDMEHVLGIGGYFLRAADPVALGAWYRDFLGLDADANGLWRQEAGPTVFAAFESETDYFGSRAQQTMINFRVRDLEAMLAQLSAKGADVAAETQDMEGVGRFGWVTDPEGNRIELWQPA
jgi:predicted enzyme related to lactoylglutathione lyase